MIGLPNCEDRHIIPAAGEIPVQDPRDKSGVSRHETGVSIEPPVGLETIGLHDHESPGRPVIPELLDLPDLVAHGARVHGPGTARRTRRRHDPGARPFPLRFSLGLSPLVPLPALPLTRPLRGFV